MHKEIRETDMQWLAKGWWRHYFKHKMSPSAAAHSIVSVVCIIVGAVLVFIGMSTINPEAEAPLPPHIIAILVIGAVLVAIAIFLYIIAATTERRDEDKFIDHILDEWEAGDRDLPDTETVAEYLKDRDLLA